MGSDIRIAPLHFFYTLDLDPSVNFSIPKFCCSPIRLLYLGVPLALVLEVCCPITEGVPFSRALGNKLKK